MKYKHTGEVFQHDEILEVLEKYVSPKQLYGNSKGVYVYNIPVSFDIETSSFYRDLNGDTYSYEQYDKLCSTSGEKVKLEKLSIMYIWQFGINGAIIIGRTWEQFVKMVNTISEHLELSEKRKLVTYVHNLSYEFQFMRKWFEWENVFSIDNRKPLYALTKNHIEFRCSYLLSGYGLGRLDKHILKYKTKKMVGDLDYKLLRHAKTPLTDKELQYCYNDVMIVMGYIQERIEEYGSISKLPLTKTGFVRDYVRKKCLRTTNKDGKTVPNWSYIRLMEELYINGIDEFDMLQRAFAGGFTHANADYSGEIIHNVQSYDFTSSYPFVMVGEKYPMSKGVETTVKSIKHFNELLEKYHCIFDIEFTNLMMSETQDNPISVSKCIVKENIVENNGRIVSADRIIITITEIDYQIIKNFYKWDKIRVGKMYCYKSDYLPTEFIESVLNLYQDKTILKDVVGKEIEYLNSKEMLNSCYGMTVTNPLRDEFTYNGVWDVSKIDDDMKSELLYKYNNSKNRFLYYVWGVYITAFARRNLFTAIYQTKDDYIYSDTDSIKIKNGDKYSEYFEAYNNIAIDKLKTACNFHDLPYSLCEPKTIEGVTKVLGVWDYEGEYRRFKTLGAKRYMIEHDNALKANGRSFDTSLTVSGVNKFHAIPYLVDKYDDVLESFSNYLDLPPEATGKNIHTYVDYDIEGEITDYLGETSTFYEKSGIHLEPTGYTLNLSVTYINYLRGIKFKE